MAPCLLLEKKNQKNEEKNLRNRLFEVTNFWKYFCDLAKKFGRLHSRAPIIFLKVYQ
jgi:hypothetical protein